MEQPTSLQLVAQFLAAYQQGIHGTILYIFLIVRFANQIGGSQK